MPIIKLQSADNEVLEVDIQVVKCSGTLKAILEGLGMEKSDGTLVPLPNIKSDILRKVIEWADYHKNDAPPTEDDDQIFPGIPAWDDHFLQVDPTTLLYLIMAARNLNIKGLLELACKAVANLIKGKTTEQIRQILNIKNDFSPAEEETLRFL